MNEIRSQIAIDALTEVTQVCDGTTKAWHIARRALAALAPCVICGSNEPHTGTCGSDDKRAKCNLAPTVQGSVDIPTWEKRLYLDGATWGDKNVAKDAEIADLRAALAQRAAVAMCPECVGQGIDTDPPEVEGDDACFACAGTGNAPTASAKPAAIDERERFERACYAYYLARHAGREDGGPRFRSNDA